MLDYIHPMQRTFLLVAAPLLLIWAGNATIHVMESKFPDTSTQSVSEGAYVKAQFSDGGLLGEDKTLVSTDKGDFMVSGVFTAMPGQKLELRAFGAGVRKLCVSDGDKCAALTD